jgi:hypothetical protein
VVASEHDDQQFRVAEIVQTIRFPINAGQFEIRRRFADFQRFGVGGVSTREK